MDYEHTEWRGAHGHHAISAFDAFVGSRRGIWIGSDGSGLIRESSGPVSFFTDESQDRWVDAGSPELSSGPSIDLFAPGCLGSSPARRARLARDPDGLAAALNARSALTLHDVQELLAEAVVETAFCRAVYQIASQLPGVEMIAAISDQIGRPGHGLAGVEHGERVELIFDSDISELLAYQRLLDQPQPFAPAGTLHSWTAFTARAVVDSLPVGIPPIPRLPCVPAGSGRGLPIRDGFHVTTGYVDDPLPQLAELQRQRTITAGEYESAKAYAPRRG